MEASTAAAAAAAGAASSGLMMATIGNASDETDSSSSSATAERIRASLDQMLESLTESVVKPLARKGGVIAVHCKDEFMRQVFPILRQVYEEWRDGIRAELTEYEARGNSRFRLVWTVLVVFLVAFHAELIAVIKHCFQKGGIMHQYKIRYQIWRQPKKKKKKKPNKNNMTNIPIINSLRLVGSPNSQSKATTDLSSPSASVSTPKNAHTTINKNSRSPLPGIDRTQMLLMLRQKKEAGRRSPRRINSPRMNSPRMNSHSHSSPSSYNHSNSKLSPSFGTTGNRYNNGINSQQLKAKLNNNTGSGMVLEGSETSLNFNYLPSMGQPQNKNSSSKPPLTSQQSSSFPHASQSTFASQTTSHQSQVTFALGSSHHSSTNNTANSYTTNTNTNNTANSYTNNIDNSFSLSSATNETPTPTPLLNSKATDGNNSSNSNTNSNNSNTNNVRLQKISDKMKRRCSHMTNAAAVRDQKQIQKQKQEYEQVMTFQRNPIKRNPANVNGNTTTNSSSLKKSLSFKKQSLNGTSSTTPMNTNGNGNGAPAIMNIYKPAGPSLAQTRRRMSATGVVNHRSEDERLLHKLNVVHGHSNGNGQNNTKFSRSKSGTGATTYSPTTSMIHNNSNSNIYSSKSNTNSNNNNTNNISPMRGLPKRTKSGPQHTLNKRSPRTKPRRTKSSDHGNVTPHPGSASNRSSGGPPKQHIRSVMPRQLSREDLGYE